MQVTELEKTEITDCEEQEILERIKPKASDENSGEKDLKLESVIDVCGKTLDLPLSSGDKRSVEELYIYKNELNLIPRAVGLHKSLKTLKFFSNEVNLFPVEIRSLVDLEFLQVKVAALGVNGLELSKLRNLQELELSRVPERSSAFPFLNDISGLKCLRRLSVCHFSIRYLPPEIGCLTNLEHLDLSFNKMRNLPDEITSLSLLISLKVTNNKLIDLPSRLSSLQRLENFDLSYNRLTSLECLELELMQNLRILNLGHNRLRGCRIPSWICFNLEGNAGEVSIDESTEMDVYEVVIQETNGISVSSSSHLSGSSSSNRCLSARRAEGWKRRHNLQRKDTQERSNNWKKWKVDTAVHSSSEKCVTCRVSAHSDIDSSKDLSVVTDEKLHDGGLFPESETQNSCIDSGNEDLSTTEEIAKECSCSAIDSNASREEDSLSDVKDLDGGSSTQPSNCVLKSKRHWEKDLDNPKPTKSLRPTNDPSHLSCQYSKISFCGVSDHLPDGFYDVGRDRPFLPLASYEKNPHGSLREVILLDREKDEELDAILLCARALLYKFKQINGSTDEDEEYAVDSLQVASLLALFVSDHFGGNDKSAIIQRTRRAVSGSNHMKPFVCTCASGVISDASKPKQALDSVADVIFYDVCEKSLHSIKERRNSIVVPIGSLQFGVCRHRALLMKYLCDRMEPRIPCELVRGYLDFSPHAWNVIVIKRGDSLLRMIVDACHPYDIREESDPEYFSRYIPSSRVSPFVTDLDASPNCSFPTLTGCDEIGKLASTSLMLCSAGSLEAAVKVRTIEVNGGASPEEVRNFEFCCLGEVRMLSVLKHSCIVEFYGHQISSKWSGTEEGNSGVRVLQSAILMEYIGGGSLKSYVDKLSRAGKKHAAPDLALYIARDIASALTEIHSKHIIHRDLKSENILIDLEKERPDGTPTVKLCDFDRAIPLHSYLHTCCIAHVGIPPPDICVGTPRWMAPEVFRAMHEQNLYGLEVDIWSFGCMLLELLTLQVPYAELPESEIHNLLQMGERPRLTEDLEALALTDGELERDSDTLRFLVKLYHQCTEKNPNDRPSAEKIYGLCVDQCARSVPGSESSEQE